MKRRPTSRITARRGRLCAAADAFPLTLMSVPTAEAERILWGKGTRVARLRSGSVELPTAYEADSFFSVQGQGETVE